MKVIVASVLAALGLVVFTAPAHADAQGYLADMENAGFNITTDTEPVALAVGLGICVDFYNGVAVSDEVANVAEMGELPLTKAKLVVDAAVDNLCPTAKVN